MGKAARNRARRKNQAAEDQQREAARAAAAEILQLADLAAFTDMLKHRPELLGETAIEELRRVAESPGYGWLFARALHLLEGARNDPQTAWEAFDCARGSPMPPGGILQCSKERSTRPSSRGTCRVGSS